MTAIILLGNSKMGTWVVVIYKKQILAHEVVTTAIHDKMSIIHFTINNSRVNEKSIEIFSSPSFLFFGVLEVFQFLITSPVSQ